MQFIVCRQNSTNGCEKDEFGVVGYSTIDLNDLESTAHVAEMRITTANRAHGVGLGRLLTREGFNIALALGIEKIVARDHGSNRRSGTISRTRLSKRSLAQGSRKGSQWYPLRSLNYGLRGADFPFYPRCLR